MSFLGAFATFFGYFLALRHENYLQNIKRGSIMVYVTLYG